MIPPEYGNSRRRPMTQIRPLAQPVHRRPGELGVHSLDRFNFSVPDVEQARKFYSSFGLDVREERNALHIHTHGNSASLGLGGRGAEEEAAVHLLRRVRGRPAALPRAPRRVARRAHRSAARRRVRTASGSAIRTARRSRSASPRNPRRTRSRRPRTSPARPASPARRAAAPSRSCGRGGWRTCSSSPATSRRRSSSTARRSGCGCRIAPAT